MEQRPSGYELLSAYDWAVKLSGITLFENVVNTPCLAALTDLLKDPDNSETEKTGFYRSFLHALYEEGADLGQFLRQQIQTDDNVYIRLKAAGKPVPDAMEKCFHKEMDVFSRLSRLTSAELLTLVNLEDEDLPGYDTTPFDFWTQMQPVLAHCGELGYGMYARYSMFRVDTRYHIVPIESPDPITEDQLVGYEQERAQVENNLWALLKGRPAANMLLVGDAGTGKSATVKALLNKLKSHGLRLVELRKDQLSHLPEIIAQIAGNPLKFVLFIDDLSFQAADDEFGALKAVLEGSAAAKTPNIVICATSNRRHIVKETFSDREGDEVHRRDTVEEQTSLSARFGLTVLFMKPNKDLYVLIVRSLADQARKEAKEPLNLPEDEELIRQAEVFAITKGGRSARVARQFMDSLLSRDSK